METQTGSNMLKSVISGLSSQSVGTTGQKIMVYASDGTPAGKMQAPTKDMDDVYSKDETYNKTEVNGLVDTPHQNYVTVQATSQTTAATDVLPASGQAADTIYRVSNWDGSANNGAGGFDVTKYSEYAWDDVSTPNKYVFLCVKTAIGEVFDISVYNNNAKYADLKAALGTNGANVPAEIRRGGMSVKFVHSDDNKYVQFRYMLQYENTTAGNTAFMNTNNWQNINNAEIDGYFICETASNLQVKLVILDNPLHIFGTGGCIKLKMLHKNTCYKARIQFTGINENIALFYEGKPVTSANTWRDNELLYVFYDGEVFQSYSLSGNDSIGFFDISEEKETNGVPAKYAGIAEALATNVPSSRRKSGMLLKFILQSTNKYVIYRYLLSYEDTTAGNNDFANPTNWVKFADGDEVEYINKFLFTGGDGKEISYSNSYLGYYDSTLTYVENTSGTLHAYEVDVTNCRLKDIKLSTYAMSAAYCGFKDSNNNIIGTPWHQNGAQIYTVPQEAAILLISFGSGRGVDYYLKEYLPEGGLQEAVNQNKSQIAEINNLNKFENFSDTKTYNRTDYCVNNEKLCRCLKDVSTAGSFNPLNWEETDISNDLQLSFPMFPQMKINGLKWKAVGDSITSDLNLWSYVPVVAELLGIKEGDYSNYGEGGAKFRNRGLIATNPPGDANIVTLFAGTNDFGSSSGATPLATFRQDVIDIIERWNRGNYDARFYLITPFMRYDKIVNEYDLHLVDYVDVLNEVCSQYNTPLLNLWDLMRLNPYNETKYLVDHLHPTTYGKHRIAMFIAKFISDCELMYRMKKFSI